MIKELLTAWLRLSNERQQLQYAYLAAAIVSLIVSGVVSLIDADLGQQLTQVTFVFGAVLVVNALSWALIYSFTDSYRRSQRRPASKKK